MHCERMPNLHCAASPKRHALRDWRYGVTWRIADASELAKSPRFECTKKHTRGVGIGKARTRDVRYALIGASDIHHTARNRSAGVEPCAWARRGSREFFGQKREVSACQRDNVNGAVRKEPADGFAHRVFADRLAGKLALGSLNEGR